MHPVLFIQSAAPGVLAINGQFCGPLDGEGQAFPAGRDAELYIQLFPFGQGAPLTAALVLRGGEIIERGTHRQLLAAGGFYENLYNSQFAS